MISRRILAALFALCMTSPVCAQQTKSALITEINTNWPDNSSGLITPALLRSTVIDIVNSYFDLNGGTLACAAHQWVAGMPTLSSITCTQPAIADVSGWGTGVLTAVGASLNGSGGLVGFNGALGTPTSGVGTNLTGVPISTGISGLGTGCAAWLATPSSANLRGCITDETGTGLAYFQGGALGTPASGTGTNFTGIPLTTAVSGVLPSANGGTGVNNGANTITLSGNFTVNGSTAITPQVSGAAGWSGGTLGLLAAGQLPGTATNDNASAGNVGEYVESVVAAGSAVAMSTGAGTNVTSISLTAGDWDVDSVTAFTTAASTSVTRIITSISTTTGTLDQTNGRTSAQAFPAEVLGSASTAFSSVVPPLRFSLSTTTTIFLVGQPTFTAASLSAFGILRARRAR